MGASSGTRVVEEVLMRGQGPLGSGQLWPQLFYSLKTASRIGSGIQNSATTLGGHKNTVHTNFFLRTAATSVPTNATTSQ